LCRTPKHINACSTLRPATTRRKVSGQGLEDARKGKIRPGAGVFRRVRSPAWHPPLTPRAERDLADLQDEINAGESDPRTEKAPGAQENHPQYRRISEPMPRDSRECKFEASALWQQASHLPRNIPGSEKREAGRNTPHPASGTAEIQGGLRVSKTDDCARNPVATTSPEIRRPESRASQSVPLLYRERVCRFQRNRTP
jgi:hypothetical protein